MRNAEFKYSDHSAFRIPNSEFRIGDGDGLTGSHPVHGRRTSLGYSIERVRDGLFFDFSDGTFKASPATAIANLTAETGRYVGRYSATLTSTPASQFQDGQYAIGIHALQQSNALVGLLDAMMYNGDDTPVFSTGGGGDPWGISLPGSYAPGSAGYLLGTRLDVPVSSRSTYSGGPVASVTAPVTVGSNNDKTGYALTNAFPANFANLAIAGNGSVTAGVVSDKTGYALTNAFPANFANLAIAGNGSVTAGIVADKSRLHARPRA